ncbi:ArgP/LysG family DNA-binding transcriptional regulator [Blastococcus sp. TBT05-19]|uniref:LysR family transcriptional regulator ArgP n=1 Tax=Blastococcus sp. TBT05-19 TaxID=2250581 RepID=UPI000DE91735|nr:LysR family transcriptional regulator ArgP [Blastococcus sp. TBT05-19]RBY91808.1 ArgP/LysG family DNA-binding transcriptional regulator [Blastococcus sp. TBT05-19]
MDLELGQLRALAAAVSTGTLDGAARELHVTPSAVSQRLKALEAATGRVLLVRSRPVRATPSGEAVLRLARQVQLLAADAARELQADDADGTPVTVPIAVNADSLATWVLPALAPLAGELRFDLHREDQEHTGDLLRDGTVMAAVTAEAEPVPGCRVVRLGAMRYRPMATAAFARRWFPEGVTPDALAVAPVVVFDRKDDLQHAYLRRWGITRPAVHHVPASADYVRAVRLGLGWGMVPDLQLAQPTDGADLAELDPDGAVDVVLHWQQWRLQSPALDRVAEAVQAAARTALTR